jgi:hypothetical protein
VTERKIRARMNNTNGSLTRIVFGCQKNGVLIQSRNVTLFVMSRVAAFCMKMMLFGAKL